MDGLGKALFNPCLEGVLARLLQKDINTRLNKPQSLFEPNFLNGVIHSPSHLRLQESGGLWACTFLLHSIDGLELS